MSKYRMLTDEERKIAERNGVDPDCVVISIRSEDSMVLLNLKTRDTIAIFQGDRKWS